MKFSTSGLVFQVMRRQECPVNFSSTSPSSGISSIFNPFPTDPFLVDLLLGVFGDFDDLLDLIERDGDLMDFPGDFMEEEMTE